MGETGEIQGRYRGDTGEIHERTGLPTAFKVLGEIHGRCRGDLGERRPGALCWVPSALTAPWEVRVCVTTSSRGGVKAAASAPAKAPA